jgi:hypothetical protein
MGEKVRGWRLKMEGGRENTYRQRQSNKTDISKHVNIQKQVTIQTRKTREGTQKEYKA